MWSTKKNIGNPTKTFILSHPFIFKELVRVLEVHSLITRSSSESVKKKDYCWNAHGATMRLKSMVTHQGGTMGQSVELSTSRETNILTIKDWWNDPFYKKQSNEVYNETLTGGLKIKKNS